MNPEIKTKWIAALRSGEYEQGRAALVQRIVDGKDRFCCLGVLCDITPGVKWNDVGSEKGVEAVYQDRGSSGYLPSSLGAEIDISPWEEKVLARMNDEYHDFNQIADYIEENL